MTSKKKVARSTKGHVFKSVYFADPANVALIKQAAAHRGLSFNSFCVRALLEASEQVLASPPTPAPSIFSARNVNAPSIEEHARARTESTAA
jgi:hypothetical protein